MSGEVGAVPSRDGESGLYPGQVVGRQLEGQQSSHP